MDDACLGPLTKGEVRLAPEGRQLRAGVAAVPSMILPGRRVVLPTPCASSRAAISAAEYTCQLDSSSTMRRRCGLAGLRVRAVLFDERLLDAMPKLPAKIPGNVDLVAFAWRGFVVEAWD
jgi:hypothetical protein